MDPVRDVSEYQSHRASSGEVVPHLSSGNFWLYGGQFKPVAIAALKFKRQPASTWFEDVVLPEEVISLSAQKRFTASWGIARSCMLSCSCMHTCRGRISDITTEECIKAE
jgi:hypothetical protein